MELKDVLKLLKDRPTLAAALIPEYLKTETFRYSGKDHSFAPFVKALEPFPGVWTALVDPTITVLSTQAGGITPNKPPVDDKDLPRPSLALRIVVAMYSHERFPQLWTGENHANKAYEVDKERIHRWIQGQANLPFDTKVRFDITPTPDTLEFVESQKLRIKWVVEMLGTGLKSTFVGIGETYTWIDDNGVSHLGTLNAEEVHQFPIGFSGQQYAVTRGFNATVNFKTQGRFNVWAEFPNGQKTPVLSNLGIS